MPAAGRFELEDPQLLEQLPEERPAWMEWRPSPNHGSRRGQAITAIIYHFTAGPSLEGTVRWFQNRASGVSAHYVIGKDGRTVQMVPLDRAAWHAGRSALAGRPGVNAFSVGIEIVNWGRLSQRGGRFYTWNGRLYSGPRPVMARGGYWEPFTEAQYQSLLRLTRYLLSRFPTITHITGHEDIALPAGRKNDPGGAFNWDRIRAGLSPVFRGHIGPLRATTSTREFELLGLEDEIGGLESGWLADYEGGQRRRPAARGSGAIDFPEEVIYPSNVKSEVLRKFIRNSDRLTDEHRRMISGLARNIVDRHGTANQVNRIRLVGHTDSAGTLDYNLTLGHKRARNVRLMLQRLINIRTMMRSDFRMPAFEECSAGASRPDSSDPALNRRVEILLE